MATDFAQIVALMDCRLKAWQALADEISAGQRACVALNLDELESHDRQKARLGAEIHRLDREISRVLDGRPGDNLSGMLAKLNGSRDPVIRERIEELRQTSAAARGEAGRRNQVYAMFLQRAQFTAAIMMNVILHCAGIHPLTGQLAAPHALSEDGV